MQATWATDIINHTLSTNERHLLETATANQNLVHEYSEDRRLLLGISANIVSN
jgi:hypothetical protein